MVAPLFVNEIYLTRLTSQQQEAWHEHWRTRVPRPSWWGVTTDSERTVTADELLDIINYLEGVLGEELFDDLRKELLFCFCRGVSK